MSPLLGGALTRPGRRIVLWAAGTVTTVVLLFGYHTSTEGSADSSASGASEQRPVTAGTSLGGRFVTGDVAQTEWGPVQVAVASLGSRITEVEVLRYPAGTSRDVAINDRALPILLDRTLSEQSAQVDMVSGATVTSDGYRTSLQSALDRAGLT